MNEVRFQEILAAYGADQRRWPEAERADALVFRQSNSAARHLREAEALDALLAGYAAPAAKDIEAIARISRTVAAAAPRPHHQGARIGAATSVRRHSLFSFGRNAVAAVGFLAAALMGLLIGFSNGANGVSTTAEVADELIVSYAMAEG